MGLFYTILVLATLYIIYRASLYFLVTEKESEKKGMIEDNLLRTKKLKEVVKVKSKLSKETEELREMAGCKKTENNK